MNDLVEVTTQAQLDKAVADGDIPVCRNGFFSVGGSARVRAFDYASVRAFDYASVEAGRFVAVTRHGETVKVNGGVLIQIPACDQPAEWCDFYGLPVKRGKVVLFKAVDDGLAYPIGKTIERLDFRDHADCGNGLHLSPRPAMARRYFTTASRFLACEVALTDLVVIADPKVSDKAKARAVRVLHEVDIDGEPVPAGQAAAA